MQLLCLTMLGLVCHQLALIPAASGNVSLSRWTQTLPLSSRLRPLTGSVITAKDTLFQSLSSGAKGGDEIMSAQIMGSIQLGIRWALIDGIRAPPLKRDLTEGDFKEVRKSNYPPHPRVHNYTEFDFYKYAPLAFRRLRDIFGIKPTDYLMSLCGSPLRELSNPGASGSIFYVTADAKFIIKSVQPGESVFLRSLLAGYYNHSLYNNEILLPKFFGFYSYQSKLKTIRIVVMNNLFPSNITMHEKYDLKGSTYKREASREELKKDYPTFKDLNFISLHPKGLFLPDPTYNDLIKTIQRDVEILKVYNVMDYSLLIGVHHLKNPAKQVGLAQVRLITNKTEGTNRPTGGILAWNEKGEQLFLYIGIIDILQIFGVKKQLEHASKVALGQRAVSVIPPSDYAKRFLDFMAGTVFRKSSPHWPDCPDCNAWISPGN